MHSYYENNKSQLIKEFINDRGIEYLIHFTRIENLDSILRYGIIPRNELEDSNIEAKYNDSHRWDGHIDANCVSISFPNYKMFYRYRTQKGISERGWVILELNKNILWEKDCAFCESNAASNEIRYQDVEKLKSATALKRMFREKSSKVDEMSRRQRGTKREETTDPQAEVLVFGTIEPKYISNVVCYDINTKQELRNRYGNKINIIMNPELFKCRDDWSHW